MATEEEQIVAELEAQYGDDGIEQIEALESAQLPKMKAAFKIDAAFLNKSASSGRKQLTIDCIILESDAGDEFVGKKYQKRWGLETDENLQWFKKDMVGLELEAPKKPREFLALCGTLNGLCFMGSLVPNSDEAYPPNCFINKGARRHDLEGGATPAKVGGGAESL